MSKEQTEKLGQLIALDKELQSIQDLDILLEKILLNARIFTQADAGTIYLREKDKLTFAVAQNDTRQKRLSPGEKLAYSVFSVDINEKSISGYVAKTKEVLNIPDVYKIDSAKSYSFNPSVDVSTNYRTQSMLTLPLLDNNNEVLGVLQMINSQDAQGNRVAFDADKELYVQHFGNSASLALERAKLTRQIILRMISMAELRDPKETGAHVNRVASYAVEIYERWAKKHGLNERVIDRNRDMLRMAAMLHDVGKVGISDLILKKPGRFTDDEYSVMKQHTWFGANLFKERQSKFDEVAAEVALTHHESWDGTGYPGPLNMSTGYPDPSRPPLKGEDIPLYGRIVSLADIYDALCSRRVYKEPWGDDKVEEEIEKMRGSKLDPELVDIFFDILEHIKNIRGKYPDAAGNAPQG
ncbi:MAG: HD domain-containing protein [Spirochaetales bacterium]|nr:HD domain-containing protein [Spirochaetales bacterium]